ncbi:MULTISPECIES: nitronate monooxygenase [unclassified Sphingopyxis]|jgi:NAD(P)H-dependent flavin oxidoreductase YrpB (nitropropane dioxygenase family)|uniref:NAD(P)H-dependent flavin oxidoreductase n=1 Tax=unclassified Sphingopyxis TaxID=2614943 RepID=UPI00286107CA|nr:MULTISPECIES: nitronate monooxygenase [unclassified Sphingopyxis]MDR6831834.1 NAD(P)H-dependent flavin oxidoreductase YrpB (nitropropane dioxygenase family) [Sphingopyxis sp. BE122]MDR7227576.1 NAD(P)H-dependent flavin oxidoreductase YrpB (nitropropane dioxygenase family) [Sphingopyxis sp. BE259]
MQSPICAMLGIEFPLLAFSHCRDVVVAVSKAGGMGVFGAASLPPARLEEELAWIDAHIGGKPYGVDLIVPNSFAGKGESRSALPPIPAEHKAFVADLLGKHGVDDGNLALPAVGGGLGDNMTDDGAAALLEVAFRHPIGLIANALGVPPPLMLELGKRHDVPVAALIGTRDHALAQVRAGVDILVVAGGEAGGHCGEVATMVLVPEVAAAVEAVGATTPILAAGGIVTGRQMAAAMAMGAHGAWTGSVWLTTAEAETNPVVKEKMLIASSRDTVRSKSRTGKPSRQLRSPWTDAWEAEGAPKPLPMPLQSLVSEPALRQVDKLSEGGHEGAKALATYWVGQGVGLMNEAMGAGQVVQEFKADWIAACERLNGFIGD